MELALAPPAADAAHPAFSKIVRSRRNLSKVWKPFSRPAAGVQPPIPEVWVAQFMLVQGKTTGKLDFDTSRAQFLGQGNGITSRGGRDRQGIPRKTTGTVLDPVFALRRRVRIPPGQHMTCTIWTMMANSREAVLDLSTGCGSTPHSSAFRFSPGRNRAFSCGHLSIQPEDAAHFQHLAGHLIYPDKALRPAMHIIQSNMRAQSILWPASISGTRPILLLRIDALEDIESSGSCCGPTNTGTPSHWRSIWLSSTTAGPPICRIFRRRSRIWSARRAAMQRPDASGGAGQVYHIARRRVCRRDTLAMFPAVARSGAPCP